jgi:hypothetical protein
MISWPLALTLAAPARLAPPSPVRLAPRRRGLTGS